MKQKEIAYAFIDSQNLNLGVRSLGWKLDYRKLRQYLHNKFNVTKAYMFIGYLAGNEALYSSLQQMGYIVVLKPTMELPDGTVKGNVDAELVLHSMIEYQKYKKAIIISGDGDFFCLAEYLQNNNKLLGIFTPNRFYSKLLRKFNDVIRRIDILKSSLELKKTKISVRSKP
jgi:uncharacterized LabA/DUF88 family protein